MRDKQSRLSRSSGAASSNVGTMPSPGKTTLSEAAYGAQLSGGLSGRAPAASATTLPTSARMFGGLMPGVDPDKDQRMIGGGPTLGETIGDVGRIVGTAIGNVVGGAVAALTGIDINSSTTSAATWSPHGQFAWQVGFTTTGTSGWLVQEVVNTYRAQDATGTDLGGVKPTAQYWEAWAVDAASAVTPVAGGTNDFWLRPNRGAGSQGHWSMRGKVYFTTTDPATQGFTPGGVPDAGILLSSTSAPSGLGIARLHRYAQGSWDSTGTTPTHTGSAS